MHPFTITPVLLCGGSGTRLWPVSRKSYPKQFSNISDNTSLFQHAALRFTGDAGFGAPIVVTGTDFRFIVLEQLRKLNVDPAAVLIEPEPRNTGPAVLAAALYQYALDPDAILLVAPSDHIISDTDAFRRAIARGLPAVAQGRIVTFGIRPDRAETGYGYIECENISESDTGPSPIVRFVEKPDAQRATQMLEAGTYLWNAGIFLARAADMIAAYQRHAPDCLGPVSQAMGQARQDLGFLRLDAAAFAQAPSISVDYAVMEKASNLSVVPFTQGWSDLGDWDAVWRAQADEAGMACCGITEAIDCHGTLLRSETDGQVVVGIGLQDMIAVAMPDAVLVAPRVRAQEVKTVAARLKARGIRQAETLARDYRPWGWYETLAHGSRFQVKRIVVAPGASLSLQSHHHRSEHWVVVEGTARVSVNGQTQLVTENQSIYVPLGSVHRMENPGKLPMVLIEVQTGAYLGEDDIIRYDDIYSRGQA